MVFKSLVEIFLDKIEYFVYISSILIDLRTQKGHFLRQRKVKNIIYKT